MSDKIVSYEIDQNNMICYIFFFSQGIGL